MVCRSKFSLWFWLNFFKYLKYYSVRRNKLENLPNQPLSIFFFYLYALYIQYSVSRYRNVRNKPMLSIHSQVKPTKLFLLYSNFLVGNPDHIHQRVNIIECISIMFMYFTKVYIGKGNQKFFNKKINIK